MEMHKHKNTHWFRQQRQRLHPTRTGQLDSYMVYYTDCCLHVQWTKIEIQNVIIIIIITTTTGSCDQQSNVEGHSDIDIHKQDDKCKQIDEDGCQISTIW